MSRISDIASRLRSFSETEKSLSGYINPTKFEKDLVFAINENKDLKNYQSKRAMEIAQKCALNLTEKIGKSSANSVVTDNFTGSGEMVLSPIYKKFMCLNRKCNGDPKSDIIIKSQMNGKMSVSIKKEGDAQIASAQVGEANAVISAALGQSNEVVQIVRETLSRILPKDSFYAVRNLFSQRTGQTPEKFDAMLSTMLGVRTDKTTISPNEAKLFNIFLESVGAKTEISNSVKSFMSSVSTRKKIFKEFASGEKRYISSEKHRSADWFMTWSEEGRITVTEIDEFINTNYNSFRMTIRDRGNYSGGSLRLDIRENLELDSNEYNHFKSIEKVFHKEFDSICLTEGILDSIVSMTRKGEKAVVNVYKKFVSAIKNLLSMIARIFAQGFSYVLEFFGLEVSEMSYSW